MATLICNGTGNLTGASTFAGAETGALALVLNRNTIESLANNATVTSATFTVTNAKVIDAVLLWVRQGAAGSTGTFKVDLQKGGVSQASVTVNRADLPAFVSGQAIGNMVPVLFKLSSTATGDGGSNWTIVLTNNNGTNAVSYAAATASTTNFTRALRTTTAATAAATNDLYILGELTGAGTHNALTVTMDSTATTAYGSGSVNSTTVAGGGIHVGYYGALTYGVVASTNYVLRVNGDVWVWEQGPLSVGASGAEMPRTSTAVLELAMTSAAGDFGLRVMDNATLNMAGLSRTSAKNINKCKLNANLSASGTTLTVDTDTGWLSGDVVCVAPTTQTTSQAESLTLSGNATSTTMAVGAAANAHSGTTPTQAEVGLLTRNVIFRSTSATLVTYLYATATSVLNVSWAEILNIGVNAVGKRGIEIDGLATGTCGAKSITYCSLHDTVNNGLYLNTTAINSINVTFSNNILWNMATAFNNAVTLSGATSTVSLADYTFDNNLMIKASGVAYSFGTLVGTFTNNTIAAITGVGYSLTASQSNGSPVGTFTGNVAHSNNTFGLSIASCAPVGTIGYTGWRNNAAGLNVASNTLSQMDDTIFQDLVLFGNNGTNIALNGSGTLNIKGTCVIAGDTTFATTNGMQVASAVAFLAINMIGVDMSGVGSIYAPHTTDINTAASNTRVNYQVVGINCKFGALTFGTTPNTAKTNWANGSFMAFQKYNQTAGDHRTELTYGQLKIDSVIYNTAAPSIRMTPNNASNKLESAPKTKGMLKKVLSGNTVSIAVSVRKSVIGDGTAYNGNQPRLIQRANPALGQSADVVIATYSASAGSWNSLSGTSSTATDDGCWEFVVDCDGTTGWINIDDWV